MSKRDEYFKVVQGRVDALAEQLNADIFAYFGDITFAGGDQLCGRLSEVSVKRKSALLILATYGGDADAAYRIARRFQKCYSTRVPYKEEDSPEFWCFIPTMCKSAGTIVTLGADKLIISADAELGPIDPQHRKKDEVGERLSGLTPTMALNTLHGNARAAFIEHFRKLRSDPKLLFSTKMAGEIAANLTIGLLKPIFEQIDPMRLAEMERSMKVAIDYGRRLDVGNLKENALIKLLSDYASHGFIIDGDEAQELFERVEIASPELEVVSNDFRQVYASYLERDEPFVYRLSHNLPKPTQGVSHAGQQGDGTSDGGGAGAPAPEGASATGAGSDAAPASPAAEPQPEPGPEHDGNVVKLGAGSTAA